MQRKIRGCSFFLSLIALFSRRWSFFLCFCYLIKWKNKCLSFYFSTVKHNDSKFQIFCTLVKRVILTVGGSRLDSQDVLASRLGLVRSCRGNGLWFCV